MVFKVYHEGVDHSTGTVTAAVPAEKIWIYKSIDVANIKKYEGLLRDLIFKVPRNSTKHHFFVHPSSGFITYYDESQLWSSTERKRLASNDSEAREWAIEFMANANEVLRKNKERFYDRNDKNETQQLPFMFPDGCFFLDGQPVLHPTEGFIDHWLVRFGVNIPSGTSKRNVLVDGALFEFRIGNNKQIIGMSAKWKDMRKHKQIEILPYTNFNFEQAHEHAEGEIEEPPKLVYLLSDDDEIQQYLLPFYKEMAGGHHPGYNPASHWSLMIKTFQTNTATSIGLTVIPILGSGKYEFQWFLAGVDDYFDNNYADLGTGLISTKNGFSYSQITIDKQPGSVQVIVLDTVTGVHAQAEIMVYAITEDEIEQDVELENEILKETAPPQAVA